MFCLLKFIILNSLYQTTLLGKEKYSYQIQNFKE